MVSQLQLSQMAVEWLHSFVGSKFQEHQTYPYSHVSRKTLSKAKQKWYLDWLFCWMFMPPQSIWTENQFYWSLAFVNGNPHWSRNENWGKLKEHACFKICQLQDDEIIYYVTVKTLSDRWFTFSKICTFLLFSDLSSGQREVYIILRVCWSYRFC